MKTLYYISFLVLLLGGCYDSLEKKTLGEVAYELLEVEENYMAGNTIRLRFGYEQRDDVVLLVQNAYGITTVAPQVSEAEISFELPAAFSQNAGVCIWKLVAHQKVYHSGEIKIIPNTKETTHLETYLGPRSISAGTQDFTMMVVSPTDIFDNPVIEGTDVRIKNQFENVIDISSIKTNTLLAWQNIKATEKSGRLLITASSNGTHSKELTSIVFPANATDFNIEYQRNHSYADGNQIMTFLTTTIVDEFGNTISDGTLVSFVITDSRGNLLRTTGTALRGKAEAKMLHPNKKESWTVTAYVTGAAQSNTINIPFQSAMEDFKLVFSEGNRTIAIGPIQSFMGQLIPDGMPIQLDVFKDETALIETKTSTSKSGMSYFTLAPDFFPEGNYILKTTVSGITKTQRIHLN